jgi:polyphosphate kinase
MGSADMMPRNLDSRVELVVPVEDPQLKDELLDVLGRCFADDTNAWELDGNGIWSRLSSSPGEARSVQSELRERHSARSAEHLAAAAG